MPQRKRRRPETRSKPPAEDPDTDPEGSDRGAPAAQDPSGPAAAGGSSTMEEELSPTATTSAPPLPPETKSSTPPPQEETASDDTRSRALAHRKALLDRLRQARTAVQQRLQETPAPPTAEITAFRDLTRQVTALARKQSEAAVVTARAPTLRKGAGQKMTAVVSHLKASTAAASLSIGDSVVPKPAPVPKQPRHRCPEAMALRAQLSQHKVTQLEHPPPLPPRRQTHWDTLLYEMQWLATDFLQERKWKHSMAKVLAELVMRRNEEPPQVVPDEPNEPVPMEVTPIKVPPPSDRYVISPEEQHVARQRAKELAEHVLRELQHWRRKPPTAAASAPTPPLPDTDKATLFRTLSERVDQWMDTSPPPLASRTTKSAFLAPPQVLASDQMDDWWTRWHVGAHLHGPKAAGKTVVACAMLAKSTGLLVCSSASVVRWMHELRRLEVPCRLWREGDAVSEGEITVCDLPTLERIQATEMAQYEAVVVDCRYPNSFRGSRKPSVLEKDKFDRTGQLDLSRTPPSELRSVDWWLHLMRVAPSSKRLIVDAVDASRMHEGLDGLDDRHRLEILALRVAFMVGPSLFATSHFPVQKCVLAWARKRIKTVEGAGTKLQKVTNCLLRLIDQFTVDIAKAKTLEEVEPPKSAETWWELRACEMPKIQRDAYEESCASLRGILSTPLDLALSSTRPDASSQLDAPIALMKLRRSCIHADLDGFFQTASQRLRTTTNWWNSSSQPNLERAKDILTQSSKMQELLSVLVADCSIKIDGLELLESVLTPNADLGKNKSLDQSETEKVAILAVLPEAQLLVSELLWSLGVNHELLLRPTDVGLSTEEEGGLAWNHCQLVLSRFNSSGDANAVNVLVCSPLTIAGDHCGLGIEAADVIVSVDEDWSGRGELVMQSMISRCNSRKNFSKGDGFDLIKLVNSDTCEEALILAGEDDDPKEIEAWPSMPTELGLFMSPPAGRPDIAALWESLAAGKDCFAFPGVNLFRHIGKPLSDVLMTTSDAMPLLGSRTVEFLPYNGTEGRVDFELKMVTDLVDIEEDFSSQMMRSHRRDDCASFRCLLPQQPAECRTSVLWRLTFPSVASKVTKLVGRRVIDNPNAGLLLKVSPGPESETPNESGALPNGTNLAKVATAQEPIPLQEVDNQAESSPSSTLSLLFYEPQSSSKLPSQGVSIRRSNMYSSLLSGASLDDIDCDGHQGKEPLVYFPPIFPRMLECSAIATHDVNVLRSRRMAAPTLENIGHQDAPAQAADATTAMATSSGNKRKHVYVTEDEATHSDAASVILDLTDDYGLAGIGAVPLPRDSAIFAGKILASPQLLGSGIGSRSLWTMNASALDGEEYEAMLADGGPMPGDEKVILLVSRKRQRGHFGMVAGASRPSKQLTTWSQANAGKPISNSVNVDANGGSRMKKAPPTGTEAGSSAFQSVPSSDAARPTIATQPGIQTLKSKDLHKNRVLITARQKGQGSLYGAPAFRAASLRVVRRASERLQRHCWQSSTAFDTGPGLSMLISKQQQMPHSTSGYRDILHADPTLWTSVVKRLKNRQSHTGDEAIEVSMVQRASLRRSVMAPSRVDFGPFQCGFLACPSGMSAVGPPRPRVGVSLPMGVKVASTVHENSRMWLPADDEKIQTLLLRYGMNWTLISRALSGFDGKALDHGGLDTHSTVIRAARSCREHWQLSIRANPIYAKDVRTAELAHREKAEMSIEEVADGEGITCHRVTVPASVGYEEDHVLLVEGPEIAQKASNDEDAMDVDSPEKKTDEEPAPVADAPAIHPSSGKPRSFAAFVTAKAKKKTIPRIIPGVVAGTPPSMVASHASHQQALQASPGASWLGNRSAMWPLQMLEAIDQVTNRRATPQPSSASRPSTAQSFAPPSTAK